MTGTLRVLSLNSWKSDGDYFGRMAAMAAQMRALAPHVVLLQESFSTHDGTIDTARFLAQALQLRSIYARARRKPRLLEGDFVDSYSGLAVLHQGAVLDCATFDLPSTALDGSRVALACRLRFAGVVVHVVNVHLTHVDDPDLRASQLSAILNHAMLAATGGAARLIAGDFNAPLDALELAALRTDPAGWHSAFAAHAAKVTHVAEDGRLSDLDHLLVASDAADHGLKLVRAGVALAGPWPNACRPSDHNAICADFVLRPPAA